MNDLVDRPASETIPYAHAVAAFRLDNLAARAAQASGTQAV
jgi:hypothetical protein